MIQDTGGVDHLPAAVLEIGVTNKERLCRERVRLHLDISPSDLVHEAGFTDVGETSHQESLRVGVDGGQTRHMLTNLLEVRKRTSELLASRGHTTQRSALQLFAPVQRITVLQKANVVTTDVVRHVAHSADLSECYLVVITVVENVHQVTVEGMNVIHAGEVLENMAQFLIDCLLGVLHLTHVELPNSGNMISLVHNGGSFALRLRQNNVDEVFRRGDHRDGLKVVHRGHS